MNLNFLRALVARQDVKIIVICTIIGAVSQKICRQYIKNNPELVKKKGGNPEEVEPGIEIKNRNPRFRGFLPRGGAVVEFSVLAKVVITFLAENGLLAGLFTGTGLALSKIPTSAVAAYLRDAFPQNLPELEKQRFILVDGEKIHLDPCDQNIQYLFMILKDPTLPFEQKEKLTRSILSEYLNLNTVDGRVNFVICIVSILYTVSTHSPSSYFLILKNLIEAIKGGKIPKVVARAIARKLKKRGLPIDPELLDLIE
jgi:hypothetical protein